MERKDIDWGSLGFGYVQTDYRYVANFKDGKWVMLSVTSDSETTTQKILDFKKGVEKSKFSLSGIEIKA